MALDISLCCSAQVDPDSFLLSAHEVGSMTSQTHWLSGPEKGKQRNLKESKWHLSHQIKPSPSQAIVLLISTHKATLLF